VNLRRGIVIAAMLALGAIGAGLFIESGYYNIGADDHHTRLVLANLSQEDLRDGRRAFWIIKHGIKMSAMPAWGKTLDDAAIWDVVSFLRKMPVMTPETYQRLSEGH
jgi:hypothetical protein